MKAYIRLALLGLLATAANAHAQSLMSQNADSAARSQIRFAYAIHAQTYFDNLEFGDCAYTQSQTMAGVRVSPEVGAEWGPFGLFVGAHAQKRFGTTRFIDDYDFTAYLRYKEQKRHVEQTFLMGAFPRRDLLDNYSNLFFRDSIIYRRPNLNGIYYKIAGKNNFVNLWLDWTGWQSATERETFFAGLSDRQQAKWFVAELQAYYFHYANTAPRSGDQCVHDNAQVQLTAGIDFYDHIISARRTDDQLYIKAGIMAGYERKRDGITPKKTPIGFVAELKAKLWHIGTHTTYYAGQPRQTVETDNHAATDWGNPLLQSRSYLQSYWYYQIFNRRHVRAQVGWTFHLVGSELYHQQSLHLNVDI